MPDWVVGAPSWYGSFLQSIAVPNAGVFAYVVAFGEILVGLAAIFGWFTGITALFGLFMNINYILSGVVDPNLVTAVETLFLMAAWRISGYYGVDRWLLPQLGTPWTATKEVRKSISLPYLWGEEITEKMEGNGAIELGAHARIRTGDLFLTKNALCQSTPKFLISITPLPDAIHV